MTCCRGQQCRSPRAGRRGRRPLRRGEYGTSWTPSPTRCEGYRRTTSSVASDTFPSRGRLGTRDVADAVPYNGGRGTSRTPYPTTGDAGRRGRRPLRRDRERGEKNKNANKKKKATRDKGFPGVSLRASGVPVCGWFSSFIAVCYARAAEQSGKHQDLK